MKHQGMIRSGIATLIAAGAWLGTAMAAQDWRPDDFIRTKLQIALFAIPGVEPEAISVESTDGNVTLIGTVPSAAAKEKVVQAANQIEGVKNVRDQLQVSSAPEPAAEAPPAGTDLQGEVVKKLANDKQLRDNPISVRAQPGGVIVLGGSANSLDDQLRALKIAHGVAGVTMVQNDMKSPPDTLYDMPIGEGAAQGEDTRNRRERQAREGQAVEEVPGQAGDAPARDEHPADINPEGDTTHSPHAAEE